MSTRTQQIVHCSYHKCLTVYYRRVMRRTAVALSGSRDGYRHYRSDLDEFMRRFGAHRIASVNNHALELDLLPNTIRISRFVRDPRDLIVSAYHYHRRGAEPWCTVRDPAPDHFDIFNGVFPGGLRAGESLTTMLHRLSVEDGLRAEMELRSRHLDSMRAWPHDDPRIMVLRYEDILGNEREAFDALARHYGLPRRARTVAVHFAGRFAIAGNRPRRSHVRDPAPAQWMTAFTPALLAEFEERWGDVLDAHGYDRST